MWSYFGIYSGPLWLIAAAYLGTLVVPAIVLIAASVGGER